MGGTRAVLADLSMPPARAGMTIGLFGGSFNPPHEGHLLVAEIALRSLGLDRLWWMVSPGNPLKDRGELAPLADRMAASRRLARNPRMIVTGFEASLGKTYSADVIATLLKRYPGVHFVWIMGADNLKGFHRWQNWEQIALTVPIAVIDRPGATLSTLSAKMAKRFASNRLMEKDAALLPRLKAPAWVFLHGPRSSLSSSSLRRRNGPTG